MSEPTSLPAPPAAALPPVQPPSGRFIVQLFLVPGLIVGVVVGLLLGFQWIFGGGRTPEKFLKGLKDPNPEVRWRTAADLAQTLLRDAELASNARFALDLCERLRQALDDSRASEKVRAEEIKNAKGEIPPPSKVLQAERAYLWYLISCVGHFRVPAAASLLGEIVKEIEGGEAEAIFRRRSLAVRAFTFLGDNLEKFDAMPEAKQEAILDGLRANRDEAGERGNWAKDALAMLEARQAGKPSAPRVAETLVAAAEDNVAYLRKEAAVALAFWDGPTVDPALLRLLRDDGKGFEPITFPKEEQDYRDTHRAELERVNSKNIAYGAAISLARRGSRSAEAAFDLYEEMLELDAAEQALKLEGRSGSERAEAVQVVVYTLKALNRLRIAQPDIVLRPDALEALVGSDNKTISTEAKELRAKLKQP